MKEPLSNIGIVHERCLPPKPTPEELAALRPGDFAKVIREGERFWCLITVKAGPLHSWMGRINNDLVRTHVHGLRDGDLISFDTKEVIQALKAEDA